MLLDVENVKKILQDEVNKREDAKAKCKKYSTSENKYLSEVYERIYSRYCTRYEGMCDMLYNLGYLAICSDNNNVYVEKIKENQIRNVRNR